MFEDVMLFIAFFGFLLFIGFQLHSICLECRYWRHMTALSIRPTLDRKDFGLPEDDD